MAAIAAATTKERGTFTTLSAGEQMGYTIEGVAQITRTTHDTIVKVVVRGLEPS